MYLSVSRVRAARQSAQKAAGKSDGRARDVDFMKGKCLCVCVCEADKCVEKKVRQRMNNENEETGTKCKNTKGVRLETSK